MSSGKKINRNQVYCISFCLMFILVVFIFGFFVKREGFLQLSSKVEVDEDILRQSLVVEPVRVSLNSQRLKGNLTEQYRFITTGHVYGVPKLEGEHPATTWIGFLPYIDQMNPDMIFLLGDIVVLPTAENFEKLEDVFLYQLQAPVFNAVGNHDVANRPVYEQRYGSTFYTFQQGPAQFIVLDTELSECRIDGTQKAFLDAALDQALSNHEVSFIFVLMHKVLFLKQEALKDLFENEHPQAAPNGSKECYLQHNFESYFNDNLLPASEQKDIYIVAGDVGAWGGNFSPFYYEYPNANITLLAAGIGDSEEDVALVVDYDKTEVQIAFFRLDGTPIEDFRKFDLYYYQSLE